MTISTISQTKTFSIKLNSSTQDGIVVLNQTDNLVLGAEYIPKHKLVSFNVFLKNFKAYAKIDSLSEAQLPNFALEDSATDKLYKVLDVEWKSPRKQLNVLLKTSDTSQWVVVGSVSILNPAGYPFRVYSLFDLLTDNLVFELGVNTSLAVQLQDVGFGLLEGTDSIVVHGSYTEEIFLSSDAPVININITGGSVAPDPEPVEMRLNNDLAIDNNFILEN